MIDIREAQIDGDERAVLELKHHYLDVRVGSLDATFYGHDALTFRMYRLVDPSAFILLPNKAVVQAWIKIERGFIPADTGLYYQGTPHVILRKSSAPNLCIFLLPVSQEEEATISLTKCKDLYGPI